MTDLPERRLAPSSDALSTPVGDETVILHLKNGTYFGLDPIATRIWALLREDAPPAEIRDRLAAEFDAPAAVIEADLARLLAQLEAHEIVVDSAARG